MFHLSANGVGKQLNAYVYKQFISILNKTSVFDLNYIKNQRLNEYCYIGEQTQQVALF